MKIRPYVLSQMELGDFTLAGYSVAGEESIVIAPELDVCFDIGKCPREALAVNHVLLTHTHTDHSAGLIYWLAQRDFQGIEAGTIVLPMRNVDAAERLLHAWGRFENQTPPYRLVGLEPGDEFEVRRGLLARTFPTRHTAGSLGFVMVDVRHKLKPELMGKTGPELVELKKQGVEIENRIEVPLVAYLGDTAAQRFADIESVRDAKVLMIECTFWEDDQRSRARDGRHIHVNDLARCLEDTNNERIVITHVTRRTNLRIARKLLRKRLPADIMEKVTFLMSAEHIGDD